jgi:hypothetical protein
MSPFRSAFLNRDRQRLPLPDYHDEALADATPKSPLWTSLS